MFRQARGININIKLFSLVDYHCNYRTEQNMIYSSSLQTKHIYIACTNKNEKWKKEKVAMWECKSK